jgi:hypothetical protein
VKGSETDVLKNSYRYVKQHFDKIDLKMDLLKSNIMKIINEALLMECRRAEDLMIENTTIKSVLKMLRPAEKTSENSGNSERKNPS